MMDQKGARLFVIAVWPESNTIHKNKKGGNMIEPIKTILMRRDGMTEEKADALITQARTNLHERLSDDEMPFDICAEWFGLEPDYLDELLYG